MSIICYFTISITLLCLQGGCESLFVLRDRFCCPFIIRHHLNKCILDYIVFNFSKSRDSLLWAFTGLGLGMEMRLRGVCGWGCAISESDDKINFY